MRRLLALSASATALAIALPSMAQDAPKPSATNDGTQVTEVVVTGFRASLQSAINAKRTNVLPIESVAPEDIGKMPDQNVAESLQRLPGVQIDHSYGQGTQVLIDGLRQNLTTLNGDTFLTGKEFYVSGEASGGGAGGNSQYGSLEGIPSEEVGRIDVYKSPNASITEGGMGGTIDLRTRDPLAAPAGFSFGGNVRGTASDNTSGETPNATLVGSYKPSSRLAFTGSVSYDDEKTFTKEYEAYNRNTWTIDNWATPTYSGPTTAADLTTLPNGQYYINPSYGYFSNVNDERKILGGAFGASWRATDALRFDFNWFYSKEDDTTIIYSNKLDFNQNQDASSTPSPGINTDDPYSIDSNKVVQNATFYATGAETATLYQHFLSEANNFQARALYKDGGPFEGSLDFSLSRADSNLQADQADVEHGLYETGNGTATNPGAPGCNNGAPTCGGDPAATQSGYQFRYSNGGNSGMPSATYIGALSNVLSDPSYALFKSNWAWANYGKQDQYALRADGSYKFSGLNLPALGETNLKISFGAREGYRDVQQVFGRYLIDGDYNGYGITGAAPGGNYLYYLDPGYTTPNIPYSTALSNPNLATVIKSWGGYQFITKNPYTSGMTNPATYLQSVWQGATGSANPTEKFFEDTLSSFQVAERTTAGYIMADLSPPDKRFNVNFGVRVVATNLSIDGAETAASPTYYGTASWNGVNSNNTPVTTRRSYTDVLPTFNAVFNLTDTQLIRLSAARVVSPQDLYSLGLGDSYNFTRNATRTNKNGGVGGFFFDGGSSGNAQLDPYRANQGLISYENYFKKGDMVSVELFIKEIESFVETQNVLTTVADDFGTDTADVSKPVNAGGGQVAGFELNGVYNFGDEWTPMWMKGFGVAANYTYSDSSSHQTTSFTSHLAIPGVSKNSVTATGFYEHAGFSARLSYTWRSTAVNDGLGGATFQFPDQTGAEKTYAIFQAPYGQLDGQVSLDLNPHVGLVFSVQNITDSALHTYMQYPEQPFTYDDWGRRYFLGIKFKG